LMHVANIVLQSTAKVALTAIRTTCSINNVVVFQWLRTDNKFSTYQTRI